MPPKKTNGQRNLAGTSAPIGENAEEVCPTHGMQTHNGVRTSDSTALTGVSSTLTSPFRIPRIDITSTLIKNKYSFYLSTLENQERIYQLDSH